MASTTVSLKYKQGSDEKEDPFCVQFSRLVCFRQYFQFIIQKNSKISYSLTAWLWYKCQEAAAGGIPNVQETTNVWGAAQQLAVTCMGECFPLQRRLWQAGQGSSREGNSDHSLSSGFWGSKILTCVKGKSPLRPFTSPSHWPFIFILVTFTMSPTWKNRKDKISIIVQTRKTVNIRSQILSIQRLRLTSPLQCLDLKIKYYRDTRYHQHTQDTSQVASIREASSEYKATTINKWSHIYVVTNKWTYMDMLSCIEG